MKIHVFMQGSRYVLRAQNGETADVGCNHLECALTLALKVLCEAEEVKVG